MRKDMGAASFPAIAVGTAAFALARRVCFTSRRSALQSAIA